MTRGHSQHQRSPGWGGIYYQLSLWRGGKREGRGGREEKDRRSGGREGEERKKTNTSTFGFIPAQTTDTIIIFFTTYLWPHHYELLNLDLE